MKSGFLFPVVGFHNVNHFGRSLFLEKPLFYIFFNQTSAIAFYFFAFLVLNNNFSLIKRKLSRYEPFDNLMPLH